MLVKCLFLKEFHSAILAVPAIGLKNWSWGACSPTIVTILFYKYLPHHLWTLRHAMYQSWTIPCTEIQVLESLEKTNTKGRLAHPKQTFVLRSEIQLCSQYFLKMYRICTSVIPTFCTEQQNCSGWSIHTFLPLFSNHMMIYNSCTRHTNVTSE